jgi:hypothetical protein
MDDLYDQEVELWAAVISRNSLRIARDLILSKGALVITQEHTREGDDEFIGVQCEPLHTSLGIN